MDINVKNINRIRGELTFDLFLLKQKCKLNETQMDILDSEIDKKIMKLLPTYTGSISVKDAFMPSIKRLVDQTNKRS